MIFIYRSHAGHARRSGRDGSAGSAADRASRQLHLWGAPLSLRRILTTAHRWVGLATAVFLFVAGTTGALIAWDHELDAVLYPEMYEAQADDAPTLSGLELARQLEESRPELRVTYLPLAVSPGETLRVWVGTRSHDQPALDYNQVALDPATARVVATRQWGMPSLRREHLMPFIYRLHYSLHLPSVGKIDLGLWLMGLVAMAWVADCFVAIFISFPRLTAWRKSFRFRLRSGWRKAVFDLHRSGGAWLWGLLLVLAFTAVSMNLGEQVVRPVVAWLSPLSTPALQSRAVQSDGPAQRNRAEIIDAATAEASRRAILAPPGAVFHSPSRGVYGVGFFHAGNDHGEMGLGNPWLYFDDDTAELLSASIPGDGSAGDVFMQAQFPLHSGRILGTPGRVVVTLLGLGVAALSLTGVILWVRRVRRRSPANPGASLRRQILVN